MGLDTFAIEFNAGIDILGKTLVGGIVVPFEKDFRNLLTTTD